MAEIDPVWAANQKVVQAASGSANELIPALSDIVRSGYWREFNHPMRGIQRFDRLVDYCNDFLHISPEAVEAMLGITNFGADALLVRKAIREAVPVLEAHGGDRSDEQGSDTTLLTPLGRGAGYILARLKRDRPDLAEQVINGELTPRAAARIAGIVRPRTSVRLDDPAAAVKALLRHYSVEQLRAALNEREESDWHE